MNPLKLSSLLLLLCALGAQLTGTPVVAITEEGAARVSMYSLVDGAPVGYLVPPGGWILPSAIGFANDGTFWAADFGSRATGNVGALHHFAYGGQYLGSLANSNIQHVAGLGFHGDNLLISNRELDQVCEIETDGDLVQCWSGLDQPRGVKANGDTIYASASISNVITILGTSTSQSVKNPRTIALDGAGNVFVSRADATHSQPNQIVSFSPDLSVGPTLFYSDDREGNVGFNGLGFSGTTLYATSFYLGTITAFAPDGTPTIFRTGLASPSALAIGDSGVPEPAAWGLAALGLGALALYRRRRRA